MITDTLPKAGETMDNLNTTIYHFGREVLKVPEGLGAAVSEGYTKQILTSLAGALLVDANKVLHLVGTNDKRCDRVSLYKIESGALMRAAKDINKLHRSFAIAVRGQPALLTGDDPMEMRVDAPHFFITGLPGAVRIVCRA